MGGDQSREEKIAYFNYMLETDLTQRYATVLELVKAEKDVESGYHMEFFNKARMFFIQNQAFMPAHVREEIQKSGNLQSYMKKYSNRRFQEMMFRLNASFRKLAQE